MQEIIKILMQRDNISYSEAEAAVLECKELIDAALETDFISLERIEDIVRVELGLDPNWIEFFL